MYMYMMICKYCIHIVCVNVILYIYTMGPGPGLVARVLWLYCMRLASSGVGGVRRVRLALLYVGSCVGVLWMFWMRLASSVVGLWGGCIGCRPKASRTHRTHPTPDDASRMQYGHKTRATSPGPGPIVRWPTSGASLGSQSLSVVAALRSAGPGPIVRWPTSGCCSDRSPCRWWPRCGRRVVS